MSNATDKEKMSIEERFEKLEGILTEMEKEETGLEASFQLYEKGMQLLKEAEADIDKVEQQIRVLSRTETEANRYGEK